MTEKVPERCEICNKPITEESLEIYGDTGMCLSCNWGAYNFDGEIKNEEDWKRKYQK